MFLFVCLFGFFTSSSATSLYRGRVPRLTSDNFTCCHTQDRAGDHDFCLSRSHYTGSHETAFLTGTRKAIFFDGVVTTLLYKKCIKHNIFHKSVTLKHLDSIAKRLGSHIFKFYSCGLSQIGFPSRGIMIHKQSLYS